MPRVFKFMPQVFSDPRTFNLARRSSSYEEALGKIARWLSMAASYYAVDSLVPYDAFSSLGMPELEECGFAVRTPEGVRARGDHEHFAWMKSQSDKGKLGAQKRWEKHSPAIARPSKLVNLNSPAMAQASLAMPSDGLNKEQRTVSAAPASPTQLVDTSVDHRGDNPRIKQLVAIWNLNSGNLPKVKRPLNKARAGAARARLSECSDMNEWTECVKALAAWPFGLGDNERGWKADFEYLCRVDTLDKFRDGKFSPRPANGKPKASRSAVDILGADYFASLEGGIDDAK